MSNRTTPPRPTPLFRFSRVKLLEWFTCAGRTKTDYPIGRPPDSNKGVLRFFHGGLHGTPRLNSRLDVSKRPSVSPNGRSVLHPRRRTNDRLFFVSFVEITTGDSVWKVNV